MTHALAPVPAPTNEPGSAGRPGSGPAGRRRPGSALRRRRLRVTLAALLALVTVGYVAVQATLGAAAPAFVPVTATATDDTFVRAGMTGTAGDAGAVIVGGSGAAVGYLKFDVPALPSGDGALHVLLLLTPVRLASMPTSTEIDVHTVADTGWSEQTVTSANAPALGPVVAVSTLDAAAVTLAFDVSAAVTRTGLVALGLTTPGEDQQRLVVSKEGGGAPTGPRLVLTRTVPFPPIWPPTAPPTTPPVPGPPTSGCVLGPKLVPTCGVLLGAAPGARTGQDRLAALTALESQVGRDQAIVHVYHRGIGSLFPTSQEISIARQAGHHRILFINWRPQVATWAAVARGYRPVDDYLDRLAAYMTSHYTEPFFFTVNHEPENDVDPTPGSGRTAADFAAMYRHVVLRLRADGVTNMVTVMDYMAFVPWNTKPWFADLYPGNDVVDWVAWDMYGYSTPHAYGYGDFAEMLTRSNSTGTWPGIYAWAAMHFPDKPLMVAEWGIWYGSADPTHQAAVFASVPAEIAAFPQIKALIYFDTPSDGRKRNSLIGATPQGLDAYRQLSSLSTFQIPVP